MVYGTIPSMTNPNNVKMLWRRDHHFYGDRPKENYLLHINYTVLSKLIKNPTAKQFLNRTQNIIGLDRCRNHRARICDLDAEVTSPGEIKLSFMYKDWVLYSFVALLFSRDGKLSPIVV